MFLSRLNEISGGRGNNYVSGSLRRILKFLGMTFLTARFCGWLVRVKGILLVSSFRVLGCDVSLWLQQSRDIRVFF